MPTQQTQQVVVSTDKAIKSFLKTICGDHNRALNHRLFTYQTEMFIVKDPETLLEEVTNIKVSLAFTKETNPKLDIGTTFDEISVVLNNLVRERTYKGFVKQLQIGIQHMFGTYLSQKLLGRTLSKKFILQDFVFIIGRKQQTQFVPTSDHFAIKIVDKDIATKSYTVFNQVYAIPKNQPANTHHFAIIFPNYIDMETYDDIRIAHMFENYVHIIENEFGKCEFAEEIVPYLKN